MRCKKLFFALLPFFLVLFNSCASLKFDGKACFAGKIFDQNGNAVAGYEILADGKKSLSDSGGIFYLENVKSGKISIRGQKKGYSSLKTKVDFFDRKNFFCFYVTNEIEKNGVSNEK